MPCLPRKHNKSRIRSTPILLSGEIATQHKGKIDFPPHSLEKKIIKDLLGKIPLEGSKVSSRTPETLQSLQPRPKFQHKFHPSALFGFTGLFVQEKLCYQEENGVQKTVSRAKTDLLSPFFWGFLSCCYRKLSLKVFIPKTG